MVSRGGSTMEGDFSAAPRLARDFYTNDGWASDPHPNEGQASSKAELNLQAFDPQLDGQASTSKPAPASDPNDCGQAQLKGGNCSNSALNFNLQINSALCGIFKKHDKEASDPLRQASASDPSWQANTLMAASDPLRHAAPSLLSTAASSPETPSLAALSSFTPVPATSPSCLHRLHLATLSSTTNPLSLASSAIPTSSAATHTSESSPAANPRSSCSATLIYASLPLLSAAPTVLPAIPVLTAPAASPPSRWRDEVPATSPTTITSYSPLIATTRLRAMASPWTPGKSSLPSLLVGDIPLL
eukprot:c17988_g1_i1 orf=697-1602(+)